jgi:hypothetical protein
MIERDASVAQREDFFICNRGRIGQYLYVCGDS